MKLPALDFVKLGAICMACQAGKGKCSTALPLGSSKTWVWKSLRGVETC